MFSGLQELLVLILLILGLIIVPRLLTSRKHSDKNESIDHRPKISLSGPIRFYIVVSVAWPLICAAIFKPWQNDPFYYLLIGIAPVVLIWAVIWVCSGFRPPKP